MKKIFTSIAIIFFLSSCFSETKSDWLTFFDKSEYFSMRIPEKWDILDTKEWKIPDPKSGKIELITNSKEKTDDFYNNLIILSEKNEKKLSPSDYFKTITIDQDKNFYDYKVLENEEFAFSDGKKSSLLIFEARYNEATPKLNFLQTANICGDKNFLITISLPKNTNDFKIYKYMLSTFQCKK